jgi:DHA1 family tetracycline resistance protein-like MFS transporter
VLGPPLMTQLFGKFSEPGAPVHFPGAPFLAAALLALASAVILAQVSKSPRRVALAPE